MVVGQIVIRLPEWAELLFGIPAILAAFGAVLWFKGFGPEDRELFRMSKEDIEELSLPDPGTSPRRRGAQPRVSRTLPDTRFLALPATGRPLRSA